MSPVGSGSPARRVARLPVPVLRPARARQGGGGRDGSRGAGGNSRHHGESRWKGVTAGRPGREGRHAAIGNGHGNGPMMSDDTRRRSGLETGPPLPPSPAQTQTAPSDSAPPLPRPACSIFLLATAPRAGTGRTATDARAAAGGILPPPPAPGIGRACPHPRGHVMRRAGVMRRAAVPADWWATPEARAEVACGSSAGWLMPTAASGLNGGDRGC